MKHLPLAGLCILIATSTAQAQVIVNEVYPNPNTGEQEWVELLNSGQEPADLQGWTLWDQLSSASIIHEFVEATPLPPGSLIVVSMEGVLNNGGDGVILKNNLGELIDHLTYSSSIKGQSWSKDPINYANITLGTPSQNTANPAQENPAEEAISFNGLSPTLSEIVACPESGSEWVELFNPHSQSISMAGFVLRDSKGEIFSFTNQSIDPGGWLAVEIKNALNNGGDSVHLINPEAQLADSFIYSDCNPSFSWSLIGQTWLQTSIVTKNAKNISSTIGNNLNNQATASALPAVLGTNTVNSDFLYPPSVLSPKLDHQPWQLPTSENIVYPDPPRLEKGALSVIMGSCLLLIPGLIYVKNRQQYF